MPFDPEFSNHSPKDLYDPRDPKARDFDSHERLYPEILRQILAAELHQMWCEWAMAMIQQGCVVSTEVSKIQKLMVPLHQAPPDAQRDQLIRAERLIGEFMNWKLVDRTLKRGRPSKAKNNG